MSKVLVVAPGRKTRGGITSVVKEYEKVKLWKEYDCRWIESYIDRGTFYKLYYFITAFLTYLLCLPACRLVHIHLSESTSVKRKALFFWPAAWLGKKIVLHFHAFSPETTIKGAAAGLYKKLFLRADAVILLSEFWLREVRDAFGEKVSSSVIYNPYCTSDKAVAMDSIAKSNTVLYAGTLNQRKGFRDLINAFAMVAKEHPQWQLVLAGNGEIKEGKELAESLGIEGQVQFPGWVQGEEKQRLFLESSIFCLPSYAEGFPMSVIEAWSQGLPIVTTPAGGLADVLVHGQNAMVFKAGDIKALSEHLSTLISDEVLRSELSSESLVLSRDLFSIETISKEVADLYDFLLSE